MSTYLNRVIALVLLLCATALTTISVAADGNAAPNKYVGTYYGADPTTIATFHSDGTYFEVFSTMFNDDPNVNQGTKTTPSQGVWRVVDKNRVRVTSLFFTTEPFGHNYRPGGFIGKLVLEAVFDKPVEGKSPAFTTTNKSLEIFLPDQNPLTDDPIALLPVAEGTWFRLPAE